MTGGLTTVMTAELDLVLSATEVALMVYSPGVRGAV